MFVCFFIYGRFLRPSDSHAPPTATVGIIDYPTLSVMKPTAFLINTSRGPLIKEPDLIRAIKEAKIAGVGLDVFDIEPLPLDHELRKLAKDRRVTLSPHLGYVDDKVYPVGCLIAPSRLRAKRLVPFPAPVGILGWYS